MSGQVMIGAGSPAKSPKGPLVLLSASPRRLALLAQLGLEPAQVDPAEIGEAVRPGESPHNYAMRMAREKLAARAGAHPDSFLIAADTVVALGRRILPKAEDAATAKACLERLSGRRHRVMTGLAVRAPDQRLAERLVTTIVHVKRLEPAEIACYLESGEWRGKAGGYGIQGLAAAFIPRIIGSYSNVVGLPLAETWQLLRGLGHPLPVRA
jgi:septum formation protein